MFGLSSFLIQSTLLQELLRAEPDIEIIPKFKYYNENNIMGALLIVHLCLMFIATESRIHLILYYRIILKTLQKLIYALNLYMTNKKKDIVIILT